MGRSKRWLVCPAAAVAVGVALALGSATAEAASSSMSRDSGGGLTSISRLLGVDAVAADDGWAVGDVATDGVSSTLIEHWNGTAWTIVASPNPGGTHGSSLTGVTALAANDAWAVGSYGLTGAGQRTFALHWDGASWTQVATPNPSALNDNVLRGVTAIAADDVWAVGSYTSSGLPSATLTLHWDGLHWWVVPSPNPSHQLANTLNAVSAVSAKDVWAVGSYSSSATGQATLVVHWTGKRWTRPASPSPGALGNQLTSVSAFATKIVWAVGSFSTTPGVSQTLIERWNGRKWVTVPGPALGGATSSLLSVSADAKKDAWAVGSVVSDGVAHTLTAHWDGQAWTQVSSPSPGAFGSTLYGVLAMDPEHAWAVGTAYISRIRANALITGWDGLSWESY